MPRPIFDGPHRLESLVRNHELCCIVCQCGWWVTSYPQRAMDRYLDHSVRNKAVDPGVEAGLLQDLGSPHD